MKKTTLFEGGKAIVRTEQEYTLLCETERGIWLGHDANHALYTNNAAGLIEDLNKEDPFKDFEGWMYARSILQLMRQMGVKEI